MKIKFLRIGITDNLKKANYSWVFLIKEICRLRFLFFEKVYVHTQKCPQLTVSPEAISLQMDFVLQDFYNSYL